jgi:hypothetical protein
MTASGSARSIERSFSGQAEQGSMPASRGALVSLAEGGFVYIRNEGDGLEELFNERDDPDELKNLAGNEAMLPILRRFHDRLERAKVQAPSVGRAGTAPRVASAPKLP